MGEFATNSTVFSQAKSRRPGARLGFQALVILAAISAMCVAPSLTGAQQPTDAQRNAVRSACRSDFIAQCSGVTPGGMEALTCLQKHDASLSKACRDAISALEGPKKTSNDAAPTQAPSTPQTTAATPPAAPAQTGQPSGTGAGNAAKNSVAPAVPMASFTPREELIVVRRTCGPDFRAVCHAVPLGGGRGVTCLRDNFERLSPGCQRVLSHGL
ncbi:hypothetical protein [Rhizobium sp. 2MFCol3.1]|uniref:hypothetical protein n=1 Tax=Rhizobium sp. 2MFCol3.1 TaxID=1246459 RepID=UPI000363EB3D|nr:hypothetical protein [Rhizobium sp. 2MFCol3.1]